MRMTSTSASAVEDSGLPISRLEEQEVCFIDLESNRRENELSNEAFNGQHKCKLITCSVDFLKKLEIKSNVKCTIANCDETFLHEPALNLHLEKVHRVFVQKVIPRLFEIFFFFLFLTIV
jgi:hypothetical protein